MSGPRLPLQGVRVVDQAGPGVVIVHMALTDASSATPVLRTIAVVIPQARLVSAITKLATGQYAFSGSVQSEGEVLDGTTAGVNGAAATSTQTSTYDSGSGADGDLQRLDEIANNLPPRVTSDPVIKLRNSLFGRINGSIAALTREKNLLIHAMSSATDGSTGS